VLSGHPNARSFQVSRSYGWLDAESKMRESGLLAALARMLQCGGAGVICYRSPRGGRIASRKTGRREERSEAFSAARHSASVDLMARSACEV